jgi:hypothetical protein
VAIPALGLARECGDDGSFAFPTVLFGTWSVTAWSADDLAGAASVDVRVTDASCARVDVLMGPESRLSCGMMMTSGEETPWIRRELPMRPEDAGIPQDLARALHGLLDPQERDHVVHDAAGTERIAASLLALVPLLDQPDDVVADAAATLLQDLLDSAEAVPDGAYDAFSKLLAHGGVPARARALETLESAEEDAAQRVAVDALDDPSPWIRRLAVGTLASWQGEHLVREAVAGLLATGQRLRGDAAEALADPAPTCMVESLAECRQEILERDTATAFAALELLRKADCPSRLVAVGVLADAVENGDPRLAALAASRLGNVADDCTRAAQLDALIAASASDATAPRSALAGAFASLMQATVDDAEQP